MEWLKNNWKGVVANLAFFALIGGTMLALHMGPEHALAYKIAAMDGAESDDVEGFNARQMQRNQRLSDMRVEINRMYQEMIDDYRKTFGREPNIPPVLPDGMNELPEQEHVLPPPSPPGKDIEL